MICGRNITRRGIGVMPTGLVWTAISFAPMMMENRPEVQAGLFWGRLIRLVVVVRYFGGTLLGVPGLIHAYKTSTQMALENAQIIERNIEKTVRIRCEYPYLNEAIRIAKNRQAEIIEQDLQLDCRLTVRIPLANAEACLVAWAQTRQIELLELG